MNRLQHSRTYAFHYYKPNAKKPSWLAFIATMSVLAITFSTVSYAVSKRDLSPILNIQAQVAAGATSGQLSPSEFQYLNRYKQFGGQR